MIAWVNGQLLNETELHHIAVDDHGFTVGDGVFEAVKVQDGTPFAMTRHLRRLERSAKAMGLPPVSIAEVEHGIQAVLSASSQAIAAKGRLRITYTAGRAPMGSGRVVGPPTLVVALAELGERESEAHVITVPWPRNERGALAGIKSTSYGENVVALAEAHKAGASEAIFGNLAGDLCEGTGSNIGVVVDGKAYTPPLDSGCLDGVTRQLVVEWGPLVVQALSLSVLNEAEEIFLMSTARDVQPVTRVNERALKEGPVTRALMQTWASRERLDVDP